MDPRKPDHIVATALLATVLSTALKVSHEPTPHLERSKTLGNASRPHDC